MLYNEPDYGISNIINFNKNINNTLKYSLDEYYNITREHINKYLDNAILQKCRINRTTINKVLKNPDILSNLTTTVMMADWTHDPLKSSQRYWRTKCLIYTINNLNRDNQPEVTPIKDEYISKFNTEREILHREQHEIITKSISKLKDRQKKIIKYRFYRNFSESKIAQRLNISQQRVNGLMSDIKYALAPDLEQLV